MKTVYLIVVFLTGFLLSSQSLTAAPKTAKPSVTLNVKNINEIAPSESLTIIALAQNASSYQWYKNNSAINGAVSQTYLATEEGSYYCVVNGAGGSAKSKPTKITIAYLPTSLAGKTIAVSAYYRFKGKDTYEGTYDEIEEQTNILRVSEDGNSIRYLNERTGLPLAGYPPYSFTYKRTATNKGQVIFKGSRPRTIDIYDGSGVETVNYSFTFKITKYDPKTKQSSGDFSLSGSHNIKYSVYFDGQYNKGARSGKTTTTLGEVILY